MDPTSRVSLRCWRSCLIFKRLMRKNAAQPDKANQLPGLSIPAVCSTRTYSNLHRIERLWLAIKTLLIEPHRSRLKLIPSCNPLSHANIGKTKSVHAYLQAHPSNRMACKNKKINLLKSAPDDHRIGMPVLSIAGT